MEPYWIRKQVVSIIISVHIYNDEASNAPSSLTPSLRPFSSDSTMLMNL